MAAGIPIYAPDALCIVVHLEFALFSSHRLQSASSPPPLYRKGVVCTPFLYPFCSPFCEISFHRKESRHYLSGLKPERFCEKIEIMAARRDARAAIIQSKRHYNGD